MTSLATLYGQNEAQVFPRKNVGFEGAIADALKPYIELEGFVPGEAVASTDASFNSSSPRSRFWTKAFSDAMVSSCNVRIVDIKDHAAIMKAFFLCTAIKHMTGFECGALRTGNIGLGSKYRPLSGEFGPVRQFDFYIKGGNRKEFVDAFLAAGGMAKAQSLVDAELGRIQAGNAPGAWMKPAIIGIAAALGVTIETVLNMLSGSADMLKALKWMSQ